MWVSGLDEEERDVDRRENMPPLDLCALCCRLCVCLFSPLFTGKNEDEIYCWAEKERDERIGGGRLCTSALAVGRG